MSNSKGKFWLVGFSGMIMIVILDFVLKVTDHYVFSNHDFHFPSVLG